MKEKQCDLCKRTETGNFNAKAKLICSICTMKACHTPIERFEEAISTLEKKGNFERVKLLRAFWKEKKDVKVIRAEGKDFRSYGRRSAYGRRFKQVA